MIIVASWLAVEADRFAAALAVINEEALGTLGATTGATGGVVFVGIAGAQCATCCAPRSRERLADKPKVAGNDLAQNLPKM